MADEDEQTKENKQTEEIVASEAAAHEAKVKQQALNWLKHTVSDIAKHNHIHSVNEVLRSGGLADAWNVIKEDHLRDAVKQIIIAKWKLEGWWEEPPGKSAVKAKNVYETKPKG
ncbi:hypothetical protein L3V82_05015 [Thiotrichales bacterium 19S3-7]|nr:hypothetical protein [Thiotrichales bacterium 19S3-7]MCF6801453.1 hypothetical protein [Thiotrichales bacterium 19S3-11]